MVTYEKYLLEKTDARAIRVKVAGLRKQAKKLIADITSLSNEAVKLDDYYDNTDIIRLLDDAGWKLDEALNEIDLIVR